jgi:hypothetical protein
MPQPRRSEKGARLDVDVIFGNEAGRETIGLEVPIDVYLQKKIVLDRKERGDLVDLTENLTSAVEGEEKPMSSG